MATSRPSGSTLSARNNIAEIDMSKMCKRSFLGAFMLALLKGSDPRDVMEGLIALRGLKAQAVVPQIVPSLKHSNSYASRDACRTLAVLGNKDLIPASEALSNHSGPKVKQDAQDAICKL